MRVKSLAESGENFSMRNVRDYFAERRASAALNKKIHSFKARKGI